MLAQAATGRVARIVGARTVEKVAARAKEHGKLKFPWIFKPLYPLPGVIDKDTFKRDYKIKNWMGERNPKKVISHEPATKAPGAFGLALKFAADEVQDDAGSVKAAVKVDGR